MTLGPSVHIFSRQNTSQFSEESATKNAEQLQRFQKGTFRAPCGRVGLAERTFAKPQICRRGFYFPSIHILSRIELNSFKVSKQEVLRPELSINAHSGSPLLHFGPGLGFNSPSKTNFGEWLPKFQSFTAKSPQTVSETLAVLSLQWKTGKIRGGKRDGGSLGLWKGQQHSVKFRCRNGFGSIFAVHLETPSCFQGVMLYESWISNIDSSPVNWKSV